ncbi:MAG: gliding motility protein GldN [Cyclobacteriaceae bacterium]|nr:gliding motility protein GldN [Cyclobacteriaceae bacterium]MCK5277276.1 gliding motility protein GldN [Cyclobacteriaceae bacterium]MCK5370685.1 gliding motility protein GldN [Cyclobacteriaceae bacterium]MCK5699592.1 gliding motility protein GldN [Cyclobacteriaceae bacterium]
MEKSLFSILILFLVGFISLESSAQEERLTYNEHSVYPIPHINQMYKRTVWRRMDLKEKQNRPFFSTSNEITRIIINAVTDGLIYPYEDDSLNKRMSKEQFFENLKLPTDEEDDFGATDAGFGDDSGGWGGDSGWGDEEESAPSIQYYDATQLNIMRIKEDMIFDQVRSRLYWDIQSFEMIIPATEVATGIEKTVGVFRYKDLEQLFRSMPDRAIWYNRQNTAHHRNMADAFLLRLFSARVVKVSNPRDDWIQDISPDQRSALFKSQQEEHKLIEYEHNLWEY